MPMLEDDSVKFNSTHARRRLDWFRLQELLERSFCLCIKIFLLNDFVGIFGMEFGLSFYFDIAVEQSFKFFTDHVTRLSTSVQDIAHVPTGDRDEASYRFREHSQFSMVMDIPLGPHRGKSWRSSTTICSLLRLREEANRC
jgi:hypothetical protein